MACPFDEMELGSRVSALGVRCHACFEAAKANVIGTYVGHLSFPSGYNAVVLLDEVVICPHCGAEIDSGYVPCEDNGSTDALFAKVNQDAEISA
jgi:hypothetical protein